MDGRVFETHARLSKSSETEHRPSHESLVLRRLNEQRKQKKVCDVTLVSQGQRFTAHICVLVTCSKYFEALHAERNISFHNAQVVHLPEVTASALEQVLEYVYTGGLAICSRSGQSPVGQSSTQGVEGTPLNHLSDEGSKSHYSTGDEIKALLHAADYLIMEDLKDEIRMYLLNSVNVENCVDYMITAYIYCLQDVYDIAQGVVMARLEDYLQHSSELCTVHPDELELILGDKKIKEVMKPLTLLDLISQWVMYDRRSREKQFTDTLFPCNIMESLKKQNSQDLNGIISKMLTNELVISTEKCKTMLQKLREDNPPAKVTPCSSKLTLVEERDGPPKKRSRVDASGSSSCDSVDSNTDVVDVVIVNGIDDQHNLAYILQDDRWVSLPELPEKRNNHGMVQYGNKLYLIGGSQRGYIPQEHCLNLDTMTWSTMPPTSRTHLNVQSLVCHAGKLYILSANTPGECYDFDQQRWSPVSQIQHNGGFLGPPKQILKATSHGDFLYVCISYRINLFMGFSPSNAHFHRYDPSTFSWEQLQGPTDEENNPIPLTSNHVLYSSDNEIVLVNPSDFTFTYHFDPENRQWSYRSLGISGFDYKVDHFLSVSCAWDSGVVIFSGHKYASDWSETHGHMIKQCHGNQKWEWLTPPPFVPKVRSSPILCHTRVARSLFMDRPVPQYIQCSHT